MSNGSQRIDPRIVRTRQLIKEAFIELLWEMDLEKISVNKIAERATINRVTFYLHYRDIPDMLEKMADEMMDNIYAILNRTDSQQGGKPGQQDQESWPTLVALLEHIAEYSKFYTVTLAFKRSPIFTDRLLKPLVGIIKDKVESSGKDSFLARNAIPKDIAVWFGSSAMIGMINSWLRADMPYTPRYLAQQMALLLPHYFGND
ncbi:TetR/AcrR family transcriptional regulator [Cohnella fermenti]|uniref:TetR/AcrR family transcriptional regulator n=1 Tax=Cohnella fermenti TaxID=2565925 RepID=A0A4S4BM95_9BACL|nr:TetR/AcrR family transcriptional regulator [Cohnella fermenti]THF75746.1 TetR/AcrR family transcriptional regulator [Cohnella fermenti]